MQKAIEKEKWHKVKFEKSTKNNRIEFSEQKTKKKKQKKQQNKQTNKQTKKGQHGNQILNQEMAKM